MQIENEQELIEKEHEDIRRHHIERKSQRKNKRRKRNILCLVVILGIAVIAAIVVLLLKSGHPIVGQWNMDGVTTYEFYKNGEGKMVLPANEYTFSYTIEDENLYIDFEYEGAKDAEYVYTIEGEQLTLVGGNATNQGTYVLMRERE